LNKSNIALLCLIGWGIINWGIFEPFLAFRGLSALGAVVNIKKRLPVSLRAPLLPHGIPWQVDKDEGKSSKHPVGDCSSQKPEMT